MDIYELLKIDHDKVKGILEKIMQLADSEKEEEQQQLLEELSTELFSHNQAEEQTFYKLLENYPETKDIITESEEEHEKVERYLIDLESPEEDRQNIIKAMRDNILKHVKKEETQLFSKSKKIISDDQISKLTQNFLNVKKEVEKNKMDVI